MNVYNNLAPALSSTIGSILVIILTLVTYTRLYSIDHFRRNIFCKLLVFCLAATASDLALLLFNGIPGGLALFLRYFFNASYCLFQILSCYFIMVFIDYMIFRRTYRSGKALKVTYTVSGTYAFILIFNYALEVLHISFRDNVFYQGAYFYIRLLICYCPLLFAIGELILYRSLLKRAHGVIFFTLPILFILSLFFDFVLHAARLNWPCVTTALLYAYFFLVQSYVLVDPLTETGNRLSFNEFTDKLSQSANGESWAIVMIDMDHFKQINDTFGHHEGDNALGYMAEIIKSCIKKDDFVARYGGDEFVLATRVKKDIAENDIAKLMNEINIIISIFNEREVCPFKLEISYGYDVYTADGTQSLLKFLSHIDDLMYKNKNERRRLSDRKQEEVAG